MTIKTATIVALTGHGLIREGLLSERYLRLRFRGLIFGSAYYLILLSLSLLLFFFFWGGGGRGALGIGILRYLKGRDCPFPRVWFCEVRSCIIGDASLRIWLNFRAAKLGCKRVKFKNQSNIQLLIKVQNRHL